MAENDKENENLVFNIGDIVAGYTIVEKIDEGGFGQVFRVRKDAKVYAMKIESSAMEGGSAIKLESDVLVDLQAKHVPNFPNFVQVGRKVKYQFLVMELLGDNLKTLRYRGSNPDTVSPGTLSRIGIQCLYAIKLLHDNGFVHRDIKPSNFAMGRSDDDILRGRMIFLFDFGLARRFIIKKRKTESQQPSLESNREKDSCREKASKKSVRDIARTSNEPSDKKAQNKALYKYRIARPHTDFRGTQLYASPNAHDLVELGRADDLFSLMYMLCEMISPLPWAANEEVPIEDLKKHSTLQEMLGNQDFKAVDENLRTCNYYTCPDYDQIYQALKSMMDKSKVSWNDPYDWEKPTDCAFVKWKEMKTGAKMTYQWEDPRDFFKKDAWSEVARPIPSVRKHQQTATQEKKCPMNEEAPSGKNKNPIAALFVAAGRERNNMNNKKSERQHNTNNTTEKEAKPEVKSVMQQMFTSQYNEGAISSATTKTTHSTKKKKKLFGIGRSSRQKAKVAKSLNKK